jgi:SAM-dependent methyltransferase
VYDAVFARYYDELGWKHFAQNLAPVLVSFMDSQGYHPAGALDIACGTGTLLSELRRLIPVLEISGLDQSEEMLKVSAAKLGLSYPASNLVVGDMSAFSLGRKFDLITCTFDALNHILEPDKVRSAFASVAGHLNPGGWYVVDVNTDFAFRAGWDSYSVTHPGGNLLIQKSIYDRTQRLAACTVEATILKEGQPKAHFNELFWERAYAIADLKDWMAEVGLDVRFTKDHRGNDLQQPEESPRVVFYATMS